MSRNLSTTKKIIFSLIPVSLLLVVLVLAEVLLRIFLPARPEPLVTQAVYDRIEWYQVNRGYLGKYFPAGTPVVPEFKPSLFRRQKTDRVFRVMCLGGSTMFGTPYLMTANIPGILRKQLRHLHPNREIEVINWGASAINSNVVRQLTEEILEFEPDLVLIYMGHNEFYGPDGVGASFLEKRIPALTSMKYALREFRLIQLLQGFVAGAGQTRGSTDDPNLMRQVSEENLVPLHSDDAERVFGLFQQNLSAILLQCKSASVPVIVSDVSSNLLFPPFVSDSSSIAYRLGREALERGDVEEALRLLEDARDNDLLKFRAPGRINEIIRSVCRQHGVRIVSSDSTIAANDDGIPGEKTFWEHLHPKAHGYYLVATLFVETIEEMNLLGDSDTRGSVSVLPFDPDSLSICWLDQAYADLSIQRLTGRWPFQDYRRATAVLHETDPALLQIATETYGRRITWDEGCYRSGTYFWSRGRLRDALTTYQALLEEYPYGFYTHYLLGSLWNTLGNTEQSMEHYLWSISSNHEFPRSQLDVGLLLVNAGEFDQAIIFLSRALELLGPHGDADLRGTALYGLSAAHANKGDFQQALAYLDTVLVVDPGNTDARTLRAQILRETGR
ncbi:MAG: tetratricopeptide repeat protein [Bacteroidota bacterium]